MRVRATGWMPCILAAAVFAGSCGGGADGTELTLLAPAVAELDGFVDGNDAVNTSDFWGIQVGDGLNNVPVRGFLTFDITSIPPTARIVKATLLIDQYLIRGMPYAGGLGRIVIDHVDLAGALDPADFDGGTLASAFAVVSETTAFRRIGLDVTWRVAADRGASRTESSYRLRFTVPSNDDGTIDQACFVDAEDNPDTRRVPGILVAYRLPP